ncbi:MAG: TIM barrel protein [Phycisphaera sp.]|nr:TIM barrel protein [Phycisphaera sp.]
MIRSCVTISLVEQARGGPFVFWDDLDAACEKAGRLGFDAVEIFTPAIDAFDRNHLHGLLHKHDLALAAVGTGAGWVLHKLSLTDADPARRAEAREFVRGVVDLAGEFNASAIIGSMQGRAADGVDRDTALGYLAEALTDLGEHAARYNVPLLYEPLNRYETNLCNTVEHGVALLDRADTSNVRLLCDLFHMNIEEVSIADALRCGAGAIGHLHFVDSNRRAAGFGHLDYAPIIEALAEIGYDGYACAEALPLPDPDTAAKQTIDQFNTLFAHWSHK